MAHACAVGTFNAYMATKNNKNKIIYHLKIPCQHLKKKSKQKKKKKIEQMILKNSQFFLVAKHKNPTIQKSNSI